MLTCRTFVSIFLLVQTVNSFSVPWPGSYLFGGNQEQDSIDQFIEKVIQGWEQLELGCDDKDKCNYFIDPDMSDKYSDLYIDSCVISSLTEAKVIGDGNDFETETKDGSVITLKTISVPSFNASCTVHFNSKGGKSQAAIYMIKGSNSKKSQLHLGLIFDATKKVIKVIKSSFMEHLDFYFTARYKYKYSNLKKFITTQSVMHMNYPLAELLELAIMKSFEARSPQPVLNAFGAFTTTMEPEVVTKTEPSRAPVMVTQPPTTTTTTKPPTTTTTTKPPETKPIITTSETKDTKPKQSEPEPDKDDDDGDEDDDDEDEDDDDDETTEKTRRKIVYKRKGSSGATSRKKVEKKSKREAAIMFDDPQENQIHEKESIWFEKGIKRIKDYIMEGASTVDGPKNVDDGQDKVTLSKDEETLIPINKCPLYYPSLNKDNDVDSSFVTNPSKDVVADDDKDEVKETQEATDIKDEDMKTDDVMKFNEDDLEEVEHFWKILAML